MGEVCRYVDDGCVVWIGRNGGTVMERKMSKNQVMKKLASGKKTEDHQYCFSSGKKTHAYNKINPLTSGEFLSNDRQGQFT